MTGSGDQRLIARGDLARGDLAWAITVGGIAIVLFAALLWFCWHFAATLFLIFAGMLLGVGLPLVFLPIMTASYDGIPSGKTDQASALLNAARNTGGSIGISLAAVPLALTLRKNKLGGAAGMSH